MQRVHTLELEDLPWFPGWMRASMTRLIVVFCRVIGVPDALAPLVQRALGDQGLDRVVDLGSGAGGVMPEIIQRVRQAEGHAQTTLLLTDKFPNEEMRSLLEAQPVDGVSYRAESVDATTLAQAPAGLKTMVNCFHHMRPDQARAILRSAEDSRQPLLIYELTDNTIPFVVWVLALPIGLSIVFVMALLFTPFVRPLTLRQLFFTYVIPLIPACYAWDGQASAPRIYGLKDLDELLEGRGSDAYTWEKGPALTPDGKARGIYLLGLPTRSPEASPGS